jgi:hypothetical protein
MPVVPNLAGGLVLWPFDIEAWATAAPHENKE